MSSLCHISSDDDGKDHGTKEEKLHRQIAMIMGVWRRAREVVLENYVQTRWKGRETEDILMDHLDLPPDAVRLVMRFLAERELRDAFHNWDDNVSLVAYRQFHTMTMMIEIQNSNETQKKIRSCMTELLRYGSVSSDISNV